MVAKSDYNVFVKENFGKFAHLPPTQRMSACAKMWRDTHGVVQCKRVKAKRTQRTKRGSGMVGEVVADIGTIASKYGRYLPF